MKQGYSLKAEAAGHGGMYGPATPYFGSSWRKNKKSR
jgi:hypothetical protein